jgi:hypothetical protein
MKRTAAQRVADASAPAPVEKRIPLRNGLPAFPGDDLEFVCRALSQLKNEKGEVVGSGTITDVVRSLGLKDRAMGGGPTTAYLRVRAALHRARDERRVECVARVWKVAV